MRTNIKTTNITLTEDIRGYLHKRLSNIEKLVHASPDSDSAMAYVEIGKTTRHHETGAIFRAEITLHVGNKSFRAAQETDDLYKAIDFVKDELMEELRSDKSKKIHLLKRGGQLIKRLLKGF